MLTHPSVRVRALPHTHAHIQNLDETGLMTEIKSGIVMSELLSEFDNHEVSVYACMFVHGAPCLYTAHDFYNIQGSSWSNTEDHGTSTS
jgi:hypothetical protein